MLGLLRHVGVDQSDQTGIFSGGWLKEPGGFTQEAAAINTKRT